MRRLRQAAYLLLVFVTWLVLTWLPEAALIAVQVVCAAGAAWLMGLLLVDLTVELLRPGRGRYLRRRVTRTAKREPRDGQPRA